MMKDAMSTTAKKHVNKPSISLTTPVLTVELKATYDIFREYAVNLGFDLCFQDFVFNSDRTLQLELIDPGAGDFTDRDNSDLISPKVALPLADPQLDDRRDQDYFFAMLCQKA